MQRQKSKEINLNNLKGLTRSLGQHCRISSSISLDTQEPDLSTCAHREAPHSETCISEMFVVGVSIHVADAATRLCQASTERRAGLRSGARDSYDVCLALRERRSTYTSTVFTGRRRPRRRTRHGDAEKMTAREIKRLTSGVLTIGISHVRDASDGRVKKFGQEVDTV